MITRPLAFLLDENIPKKVLSALRDAGYTVSRARDERLAAQPDEAIFVHARARQMVIVTFDKDYLNKTRFPPPHAGILVLRSFPRRASVATIITALLNAIEQLAALDLSNRVFVVEPDKVNEVSS